MSHLFPCMIVKAVGQIDLMVEKGALRRCRGHYCNLGLVVRLDTGISSQCDRPTVSESNLYPCN